METGLSNPFAVATVASSKQGQKAIGQGLNAIKIGLLIVGAVLGARYTWSKYKEYRADKFARDNVGSPNVIAAAIIYNSFTRFEFPGVLSWLLPSIDISTDEAALNNIATRVTNVKAVSDAYHILFDRNLTQDTIQGLSTSELDTFWQIINSPQNNNSTTLYPIGSKLYVAELNGIIVNLAKENNGTWIGTNDLYKNLSHNELVGEVIATGQVTEQMVYNTANNHLVGQNYYIVKEVRGSQCLINCEIGVVIQQQVTNKQL